MTFLVLQKQKKITKLLVRITFVVDTQETSRARARSKSTATILQLPAHFDTENKIEQIDGAVDCDICELVRMPGQGKDMDYAVLPPGVLRPPGRARHWEYGIGEFDELGRCDEIIVYNFPDPRSQIRLYVEVGCDPKCKP